eukprot:gene65348-89398_t
MLRGSGDLMKVCKDRIGPKQTLSADGKFYWEEVECLGACVNAPMAMVNDYYFEDLTASDMNQIIDDFAAGKTPKPGPRVDRVNSAPEGGALTLTDPKLYDGSAAKPITNFPFVPTLKVTTTTRRHQLLIHEMDINAGRYLDGESFEALTAEYFELVLATAGGRRTQGEHAGHSQVSLWRNWRQTDTTRLATLRARPAPDGPPHPVGLPLAGTPS